MKKFLPLGVLLLLCTMPVHSQKKKNDVLKQLDAKAETYSEIAHSIWNFAEMGYLEEKSSALLQETLAAEGFSIETGIAGIPTAFVAEYGSGYPVIGILGEYDALPGLSQEAVPEKNLLVEKLGMPVAITCSELRPQLLPFP